MKLTKTKTVVEEEIELQEGVYFYKDNDEGFYKTVIKGFEEDGVEYLHEIVYLFSNFFSVKIKEDKAFEEDELPYRFLAFIKGVRGEKITEEEFNKQKQEVLNKLTE